ncbi:MAG: GGDEF domain-containing protein [Patescibacteria group bacterium]
MGEASTAEESPESLKKRIEMLESEKRELERAVVQERREADDYYDYAQRELVGTDPFTGFVNKPAFQEELDHTLALVKRHEMRVALVMIDLDHFKQVNTDFGHQGGDAVLQKITALFRRLIRKSDTIGRIGGEEFAIIMRGTNAQGAAKHAEDLKNEIKKLTFDGYDGLSITASFGIASSENSTDTKELYNLADTALNRAKDEGRDRVVSV